MLGRWLGMQAVLGSLAQGAQAEEVDDVEDCRVMNEILGSDVTLWWCLMSMTHDGGAHLWVRPLLPQDFQLGFPPIPFHYSRTFLTGDAEEMNVGCGPPKKKLLPR